MIEKNMLVSAFGVNFHYYIALWGVRFRKTWSDIHRVISY